MGGMKILTIIVGSVVAFAGLAAIGLRGGRAKVIGPSEIKPGLMVAVNSTGIGLFAARTAPGANIIFFDTGLDQDGHPLDALLRGFSATRDDVKDVFLTHGHFDHVSGAPLLTKARVHLGVADVPLAEGKVPPETLLPRVLGLVLQTQPVSINTPITGAGPVSFPVGVDVPGADPAKAKVVKAIPVPGHTPGSYAYLYDGVLIAGDIMILKQGRLEPTPSMFDPHPAQNLASIRSLKAALANETLETVCTAHGGCTPPGLGRNLLDDLIKRVGG